MRAGTRIPGLASAGISHVAGPTCTHFLRSSEPFTAGTAIISRVLSLYRRGNGCTPRRQARKRRPVRYRCGQRVSHADVDFVGEQKLSSLLSLCERAAVEASEACGFGPEAYARAGRVWIVRRTRLWRFAPVGGLDHLEIDTAIADVRRARSLREYRVWRGACLVAEAATDWVYCDVFERRPVRVTEALITALAGGHPVPSLGRAPYPTLELGTAYRRSVPMTVRPSHLDHVQHVNNATYADVLDDAALAWSADVGWPLTRMLEHGGALRPVGLDIEYLDDASVGDELEIETWGTLEMPAGATVPSTANFAHVIRRHSGSVVVRAVMAYAWRWRAPILGRPPSAFVDQP